MCVFLCIVFLFSLGQHLISMILIFAERQQKKNCPKKSAADWILYASVMLVGQHRRKEWGGTGIYHSLNTIGSATQFQLVAKHGIVCWLLNVPATCECISGTDLLRQFYVLPHWDRSCRSNFPSHPVIVYWHQSQHLPYNARRLAG